MPGDEPYAVIDAAQDLWWKVHGTPQRATKGHFTGMCAHRCPSNKLEDAQCWTRLKGLEATATSLDCSAQRLAPGPILREGTCGNSLHSSPVLSSI